jgi:acetyl-CoA carboxylase biotin carboxyl carrier protein
MARQSAEDEHNYAALVRDVLEDLAGTSITRLELTHGELRLSLRRSPGIVAGRLPRAAVDKSPIDDSPPEHWHRVEAPLTGIYYARPAPDQESYVHIGSHVEPEQVLGLIETMKMFNEVTADISGTISSLVAVSGALVHAGDVLMYIEPGDTQQAPTFTSA